MSHDNFRARYDQYLHEQKESREITNYDMKSLEKYWEKILEDEQHKIGFNNLNTSSSSLNRSGSKGAAPARKSIGDRSREWVEQKNKKLQEQKEIKKSKELDGCTFKPHFYTTKLKSQFSDENDMNMRNGAGAFRPQM